MKNLVVYCHNIQGLAMKDEKAKLKKEKNIFSNKRRDIIVLCDTKCTEKLWIEGTSCDSQILCQCVHSLYIRKWV